jgi:hypothetical protein
MFLARPILRNVRPSGNICRFNAWSRPPRRVAPGAPRDQISVHLDVAGPRWNENEAQKG